MSEAILLNPWGLAALGTLGAVLAIYLFYQRFRPKQITGLFLWGEPDMTWKGGRRREHIHRNRSLLLDLLVCALLALALAGPAFRGNGRIAEVIILDGSLSMRAASHHASARADAIELLNTKDTDSPVAVLFAGENPTLLAAPDEPRQTVLAALAQYNPFSGKDSVEEAVFLARELFDGPLRIHLFTDRELKLSAPPESELNLHVYPGKQPNVVLANAARLHQIGSGDILTLGIVNCCELDNRVTVDIRDGQKSLHQDARQLSAGERWRTSFSLSPATGQISVELSAQHDALPDDSRATLLPAAALPVTFSVRLNAPETARAFSIALSAAGAIKKASGADLLITDGIGLGKLDTVCLQEPKENCEYLLGPFVVDSASALCRDAFPEGIIWPASSGVQTDRNQPPLISAGKTPLYWRGLDGRLYLNLSPRKGNILHTALWPVLWANLVSDVRRSLPGLHRTNYAPQELLEFVTGENTTAPDGLLHPDGMRTPLRLLSARLPSTPGIYTLVRGEKNTEVETIAVNPLYAEEGDLQNLAPAEKELIISSAAQEDASPLRWKKFDWLCLLLAASLLALNWHLDRAA